MAAEGTIELIMNNPTAGQTDGEIVSQSTQQFPVTAIVNTQVSNYVIKKMALRCTSGWQSTGPVMVVFSGATAAMWQAVDDDNYVDADQVDALATWEDYIVINDTIGATNHIIWFKISTDGTESAMVDTSVLVNVYGHAVPTP